MNIQAFFDQLKLELSLLKHTVDDEFEMFDNRPLRLTVAGSLGSDSQAIAFGFYGDRKVLRGAMSPEAIASAIHMYLQTRNVGTGAKPQPNRDILNTKRPYDQYKQSQQQRPHTKPIKPQEPKRRVWAMGPSQFQGTPLDQLRLADFDGKVQTVTVKGEIKTASDLVLADLPEKQQLMLKILERALNRLNKQLS